MSEEERRRERRWDDPDGAIEEAHQRARLARDWSAHMLSLTGTGEAERGGITVEVDADGILRRLEISDTVATKGGRVVELGVLSAVNAAQTDVTSQAESLTAQAWGPDSRTTHVVTQEYAANESAPRDGETDSAPRNDGGQW